MWDQITESDFEAKIEKERRDIIVPIICFGAIQLAGFLTVFLGMPDEYGETKGPVPFLQYLKFIPWSILWGVVLAVGFYVYNYFIKNHYNPKVLQCTKCEEIINLDSEINTIEFNLTEPMICKCGGNLIDQRKFKWIEEEENKK